MTKKRSRTQRVNTELANLWLDGAGLSIERFSERVQLSEKTIRRLLQGEPAYLNTIRTFAEYFDKSPSELLGIGHVATSTAEGLLGKWAMASPLGPVQESANGLQYRLFKLSAKSGELARGKRYVLDHLTSADRRQVQEHLLRHTNVCNQVGDHPSITRHIEIKSGAGEDLWWVIDEWIEGARLDQALDQHPLDYDALRKLMRALAGALQRLHASNVIMRQLSPHHIMLDAASGTPILVDFEMAKLLDRRPTVSPSDRWPEDDYRAPEVGGPQPPTPAADLYSWARILIFAATGTAPPSPGRDLALLRELRFPETVHDLVSQCLELDPAIRPQNVAGVLRVLSE